VGLIEQRRDGRLGRPRRGAVAAIALPLVALGLGALAAQEAAPPAPIVLERGTAAFEVAGGRVGLVVWTSPAGPLFALAPIVERLGGELVVGPLGVSHQLDVGGSRFLFGSGSATLAAGEQIELLSQAPIAAPEGLLVPLDLLSRVYAPAGYELAWDPAARLLAASRRNLRRLPVAIDVDHFQGVTTVVLEFGARPDYRIVRSPREVRVQVLGDELVAADRPGAAPLVAALEVRPQEVLLRLEAGAATEDYTLEDPFRLVLEIFKRPTAPQVGVPLAPFPLRRARGGLEVIVIDPGHGGGDTGAIGPGGAREKDLTLTLSERLAAALRDRLPVRVVLTRTEDAELPLATRAALGNELEADLFLSLHLNSSYGRSARGTETYFLSLEASDERAAEAAAAANAANGAAADPAADLELILWDMAQSRHLAASQQLANLIQEELNQALELRDRGVKQAPFTVLMGAAMPAVLVELGFLSNPEEEQRLRDPAYQTALTDALVRAISRFRALEGEPLPEAPAGVERR
jgi:N-acetylmuramoyl-L-alanine amidase